jgi:hypothetical protein
LLPLVAAAIALGVAGCFNAAPPPETTTTPEPSASLPPLESLPPSTASESAPPVTTPSTEPAPSGSDGGEPSSEPQASASAGAFPGSPNDCTGNQNNKDFFAAVADAAGWDVFCPVLPTGWFVDSGSFRLANGGWLMISYNGPGDARIELSEGAFCDEPGGCVPDGTEVGSGLFGDREGTVVAATDGSWAISVDRGAPISWVLVGSGVDEAAFRDLAGSLLQVG